MCDIACSVHDNDDQRKVWKNKGCSMFRRRGGIVGMRNIESGFHKMVLTKNVIMGIMMVMMMLMIAIMMMMGMMLTMNKMMMNVESGFDNGRRCSALD